MFVGNQLQLLPVRLRQADVSLDRLLLIAHRTLQN